MSNVKARIFLLVDSQGGGGGGGIYKSLHYRYLTPGAGTFLALARTCGFRQEEFFMLSLYKPM